MKPLYEQKWFCDTILYLNAHWPWWNENIYGKSSSIEDFCRNPAEVFRDKYFPFTLFNVYTIGLIRLRLYYNPREDFIVDTYNNEVLTYLASQGKTDWFVSKMADAGHTFRKVRTITPCRIRLGKFELALVDIVDTKFPNAFLSFQLGFSLWYYVIPAPFIWIHIRYSPLSYFQTGIGWLGEQHTPGVTPTWWYPKACLGLKFRFASYLKELEFNPGSECFKYYEGAA